MSVTCIIVVMVKPVRMHVARTPSQYVDKAGNVHRYESVLGRRIPRRHKVRHETVANLSKLPAETITAIEATLKGQTLVAPRRGVRHSFFAARRCSRGSSHGPQGGYAGLVGASVSI